MSVHHKYTKDFKGKNRKSHKNLTTILTQKIKQLFDKQ